MYEVLVPIGDNPDRAAHQVSFVADMPCASTELRATLTHALGSAEQEAPEPMRHPGRVKTVRDARDDLEDAGVEVQLSEISAPPSRGILSLAEELDADLIVMAARKRSPAGKLLFGSVTQTVLLNTDRTVAVTGETEPVE
ncbi:MAG: universal stress protein [Halorientalis sp.]